MTPILDSAEEHMEIGCCCASRGAIVYRVGKLR